VLGATRAFSRFGLPPRPFGIRGAVVVRHDVVLALTGADVGSDAAIEIGLRVSLDLAFAPYGCEPRLVVARESLWAIVMSDLNESCSANVIAPSVEIEEAAIAITAKPFLVVSSRV